MTPDTIRTHNDLTLPLRGLTVGSVKFKWSMEGKANVKELKQPWT